MKSIHLHMGVSWNRRTPKSSMYHGRKVDGAKKKYIARVDGAAGPWKHDFS